MGASYSAEKSEARKEKTKQKQKRGKEAVAANRVLVLYRIIREKVHRIIR